MANDAPLVKSATFTHVPYQGRCRVWQGLLQLSRTQQLFTQCYVWVVMIYQILIWTLHEVEQRLLLMGEGTKLVLECHP
jgi:hypothetical protein